MQFNASNFMNNNNKNNKNNKNDKRIIITSHDICEVDFLAFIISHISSDYFITSKL
jgi:hypothetical protein